MWAGTTVFRQSETKMNIAKFNKRTQDLVGRTFGDLTVVGFSGIKNRLGRVWDCSCACGGSVKYNTARLNSGRYQSCGCWAHRKGSASGKWAGVGEISGSYWSCIRSNAKRRSRNVDFHISMEYAWRVFEEQGGRCAYTGETLSLKKGTKTGSLDRIDSSKGYIEGNVQWVHKWVNLMKLDHDHEEFLQLVRKIYLHSFHEARHPVASGSVP